MPVFGKCPTCGPNAKEVPLRGIWCDFHYQVAMGKVPDEKVERTDVKAEKAAKQEDSKAQKAWYTRKLKQLGKHCENCKEPIEIPRNLPKSTAIAHIVPKGLLPSVATHDVNSWDACHQCHHDYDHALPGDQAQMPVAAICRERFQQFDAAIAKDERRHIPAWLLDTPKPITGQAKAIKQSTSSSKRKRK